MQLVIPSREFIQERSYRQVDSTFEIVYKSVAREEIAPQKGFVRGHSRIGGVRISQQGSQAKVELVSQLEVAGKVPVTPNATV